MTPMVATGILPHFGRLACAYFHTSAHPIDNLGVERFSLNVSPGVPRH
jgi:hypothetical protein